MKIARFILKVVGVSMALAGVVCLIIGFWDKLVENCPCRLTKSRPSEFDDYADIDC